MKLSDLATLFKEPANGRTLCCNFFVFVFLCSAFFIASPFVFVGNKQGISSEWATKFKQNTKASNCKIQCKPLGTEPLPKDIISVTSNIEMWPKLGSFHSPKGKDTTEASKSLLAIAVGIKQKEIVDQIVKKFFSSNFSVILFHYDGAVDEWRDLKWSPNALHISAINQTKWWFAKRFLHPDIVAEYNYIFLWDEDLGVEHFHPGRYISVIEKEELEISQPALDVAKSRVHHQLTARGRKGDVHRRTYKNSGGGRCYANSTAPPCTGWVELMAPVFSRSAWPCVWQMIQNDLIHAWGLDMKLGYCAQGDRSKHVGVVDSEYIVHMGIATLGSDESKSNAGTTNHVAQSEASNLEMAVLPESPVFKERSAIRQRSYTELEIFRRRWQRAVAEDKCWTDPYPQPRDKSIT